MYNGFTPRLNIISSNLIVTLTKYGSFSIWVKCLYIAVALLKIFYGRFY